MHFEGAFALDREGALHARGKSDGGGDALGLNCFDFGYAATGFEVGIDDVVGGLGGQGGRESEQEDDHSAREARQKSAPERRISGHKGMVERVAVRVNRAEKARLPRKEAREKCIDITGWFGANEGSSFTGRASAAGESLDIYEHC